MLRTFEGKQFLSHKKSVSVVDVTIALKELIALFQSTHEHCVLSYHLCLSHHRKEAPQGPMYTCPIIVERHLRV